MQKNAAKSNPGEVRIASLCRNATHGASGSDQPKKPSMYIDTGAILSLQNGFVEPPARPALGVAVATHVGSQS